MSRACPANGCDGEIKQEFVGGWSNPDVVEYSTCLHIVYECTGCGEWKAGQPELTEREYYPAHTAGGGAAGEYKTLEYCADCAPGVSGK